MYAMFRYYVMGADSKGRPKHALVDGQGTQFVSRITMNIS